MNLITSTPVYRMEGLGEIEFPKALKRDLLTSTIHCQSLYFTESYEAINEGYYVVWDCSYYLTQNGTVRKNVLALFQNRPAANVVHFYDNKVPLVSPQEKMNIEIIDYHGDRQDVSALAVIGIYGKVGNKLLTI